MEVLAAAVFAQTTTHATLLARVAVGTDPTAWREFAARYGELIRGFALRRNLQAADCDDVVQEVLLSLSKSMPNFQYDPAKGKFRSYLKTVVLHAIFKFSRQKQGEVALEDIEQATRTAAADESTERFWDAEWRQYHLRQAMQIIAAEFNPADRAAFQAYAVEGRDAPAVAAELGLSLDQVYQAKSRILKRLGQVIERQVEDEG